MGVETIKTITGRETPDMEITKEKIRTYEGVYGMIKKRILSEVPQLRDGINFERLNRFLQKRGVLPQDFIVYDKKHRGVVEKIYAEGGQKAFINCSSDLFCVQDSNLDLVIVERDPENETGEEFLNAEMDLIHEFVHGSKRNNSLKCADNGALYRPGAGLLREDTNGNPRGTFFEEAVAELTAVQYREELARDKRAIDKLNGLVHINHTNGDHSLSYDIPLKYVTVNKEGGVMKTGALSAYALELMIKKDPSILDTLEEARSKKTEDALKNLAQKVNDLSAKTPDLFETLDKITYPYTVKDFLAGMNLVQEATKEV